MDNDFVMECIRGGFAPVLIQRLIHEGAVCKLCIPNDHRKSFVGNVYEACNNQSATVICLYKNKESGEVFVDVKVLTGAMSGLVLEKVKSIFLEFKL